MRDRSRRTGTRRTRWGVLGAACALLTGAVLVPAAAPAAMAAPGDGCSTAAPDSGRYASTLCWFDFTGYDPVRAASAAGQDMQVGLPGGSTLSFTVRASGGPVRSDPFPTYGAAYLGNGAYTGVAGRPALYQTGSGTTTDLVLSGIRLTTPSGQPSTAFSLVGADAESTDARESIVWNSDKPLYSLTANGADPGIGNACGAGFTGLGTREVRCAATTSSTKTGTPIVASEAPGTFSQRMIGGGRQAVAFGVLISQIELTKRVDSRFTGDAFEIAIEDADGQRLYDASTGATGTTATTGQRAVLASGRGASFRFSERATSGSLDRYDVSWDCSRNGQHDPTLPNGYGLGTAADVRLGIGDFVSCTIANDRKPTSLMLQKRIASLDDANGNGLLVDAGDTIGYEFEVTNTGELPLTGIAVDDPKVGSVSCPAGQLAPGATVTCTADQPYTVTIGDQNAGSADNTATASGDVVGTSDTVVSNESSTSTPLTAANPAIELTKLVTPAGPLQDGEQATYHFVVVNTGNVPIQGVEVHDDPLQFTGNGALSAIVCPAVDPLQPGRSMTCTATYTMTQADVDQGQVRNFATASGTPMGGLVPIVSNESQAVIPAAPEAALALEKTVSPDRASWVGDTVTYTYHVVNTGTATLSNPQIVENAAKFTGTGTLPAPVCPSGDLAPGASVDCTASYTLTQADVDAGFVDNFAEAEATAPPAAGGGQVGSDEDEARVTVPRSPGSAITLEKTADRGSYAAVGDRVEYTFVVTNHGNVSLHDVVVDETDFTGLDPAGLGAVDCGGQTALDGGASMTCTAVYDSVTQGDLDAGSIFNEATASGTPADLPGGTPADRLTSAPDSVLVGAVQTPAIELSKAVDPAEASEGDVIRYSFTVTNRGNVTLTDPEIDEAGFSGSGRLRDLHCPPAVLLPGGSVLCGAEYTVAAGDRAAGLIDNTATATALPPAGVTPPRSNEASARVRVLNPALSLVKTADVQRVTRAGQVVTYSFKLTNTGNVPLADPVVEEQTFDGKGERPVPVCPSGIVLQPGESVTCTARYTTVAADLTGAAIHNVATARAEGPNGTPVPSGPSQVDIGTAAKTGALEATGADGVAAAAGVALAAVLLAIGAAMLLLNRARRRSA